MKDAQRADPVVTPPLRARVEYRLYYRKLDPEYLPWLERDLASPMWALRMAVVHMIVPALCILPFVATLGDGYVSLLFAMPLAGGLWQFLRRGERINRDVLLYNRGEISYMRIGRHAALDQSMTWPMWLVVIGAVVAVAAVVLLAR